MHSKKDSRRFHAAQKGWHHQYLKRQQRHNRTIFFELLLRVGRDTISLWSTPSVLSSMKIRGDRILIGLLEYLLNFDTKGDLLGEGKRILWSFATHCSWVKFVLSMVNPFILWFHLCESQFSFQLSFLPTSVQEMRAPC